ncbi:hypothetical protein [Asticcacaulis sp. YBE204]|uniref:hypothetical protein n=1 Tax=Asticcacaulis sp. YBE204 TaxID=1282363 RepID=UPI0003C3E7FD|nr:hypothetical protein [Asticcacaulis sp. YBE204]ESQ81356.1 hypothetical protein AEYBE204_03165 [Asticcacaulis sp. YBE204]
MKVWTPVLASLVLLATTAQAQNVDPASDLGKFRALRAEGIAALQKNERQKALDLITQAGDILPDSPSILLLKAQVELEMKRKTLARAHLVTYLRRGMVVDLKRYTEFEAVWDAELESMQVENASKKGALTMRTEIGDLNLIEGVAVAEDGTLFATALRMGIVGTVGTGGIEKRLGLRAGVAANAIGLRDGVLWASTAPSRQTIGYKADAKLASKIVKVDPSNGKILGQYENKRPDRRLSDMLLGKEDLYVSDGNTGEVLRLTGYQGTLDVLIPEGYLGSPQGLAENEGATALIVADYSSGLYRVDLAAGTIKRLRAPQNAVLLGLDGLYRYGNDIIAVQNGFKPNRILRLKMSADWGEVESVEVLLRGTDEMLEPTGGQIVGDKFIFVARSQWSEFDDKGNIKNPTPEPAVIGEITLVP